MSSSVRSSLCALLSVSLLLVATLPAARAADSSVQALLDEIGITYEVDEDGDYKVVYSYADEGRTQLVFVSGGTESVAGMTVREVFAPAGRVEADGIDGDKALELMAQSRYSKLGSWEIAGDILYFVVKLPDDINAVQLHAALSVAAQTADNMEIELSGERDEL